MREMMFWISFVVSLGLIIGGFFVPPLGVIDGSVLTAVGLLLAFATVAQVPSMLEAASHIHIKKGDISVEVHTDEESHNDK